MITTTEAIEAVKKAASVGILRDTTIIRYHAWLAVKEIFLEPILRPNWDFDDPMHECLGHSGVLDERLDADGWTSTVEFFEKCVSLDAVLSVCLFLCLSVCSPSR